ncbi:MAG: apolipoprotein N-acyltransferase [Phycisphaerales bacterium]
MLSALAFALSFPLSEDFVAGWPLAFVWPALLGACVRSAASWRTAAVAVGVPYFAAFLAHEWWMHEVTVLGMPVLVAYLAAWTVVLALVVRTLGGTRHAPRAPFVLVLPVALVAVEFLRGDLVCTGYAWFFAAHPLVEWPAVAQVASIGGGWMLSALVAVVAGGVLDACIARGARRVWSPAAALACLGGAVAFGAERIAAHDAATTPPERALLIVQTNLPMSNKLSWEPAAQVEDFVAFARLTIEGAMAARQAGESFEAAVWPETMVPGFGLERESIRALLEGRYFPGDRFEEGLRDLSSRIGTPLVVGSPAFLALRAEEQRWAWDRQFNSAYLVDATGARGRTDKIFLTPFGETMPIISNWDWLEQRLLDLGASGMTFDLDVAAAPSTLTLGGAAPLRMGVPICFEITKPWASRTIAFDGAARKADVLVNISNDGWFSGSTAGRRQHLQVAQLRAAELSTPVVRAANTGISASIDATGRINGSLGAAAEGTLVARFRPAAGTPLAAHVGDGFAFGMLLLAVLGCALAGRVKPA